MVIEVALLIVVCKVLFIILFVVFIVLVLPDEELVAEIVVVNVVPEIFFDKVVVAYVLVLVEIVEREFVKVVFEVELVVILDFTVTIVVVFVVIVVIFLLFKPVVSHQKFIGPVGSNLFLVIIIFSTIFSTFEIFTGLLVDILKRSIIGLLVQF
jgi:hypothetical protein